MSTTAREIKTMFIDKMENIFPFISFFVMQLLYGTTWTSALMETIILLVVIKVLRKVSDVDNVFKYWQNGFNKGFKIFVICCLIEWALVKYIFTFIYEIGKILKQTPIAGDVLAFVWFLIMFILVAYLPFFIDKYPIRTERKQQEEKKKIEEKRAEKERIECEKEFVKKREEKKEQEEEKIKQTQLREELKIKIEKAYEEYDRLFDECEKTLQKSQKIETNLKEKILYLKELLEQKEFISNDDRLKLLISYKEKYDGLKVLLEDITNEVEKDTWNDLIWQYIRICAHEKGELVVEYDQICKYSLSTYLGNNPLKPKKISYTVMELSERIKKIEDSYKKEIEKFNNLFQEIVEALEKDYISTKKGYDGEKIVDDELEAYSKSFYHLKNIVLAYDGETCEIDQLIISPHGIFVVEVKNIESSGRIKIEIDNTGAWKRVSSYSRDEIQNKFEKKLDPKTQNNRSRRIIENLLNDILCRQSMEDRMEVLGIIVIANNTANIDNQSKQVILRPNGIIDEIRKHKKCLDQEEMEIIKKSIESKCLPALKFEILKYKELYDNFELIVHDVNREWNDN